jgi:hypothetical protein
MAGDQRLTQVGHAGVQVSMSVGQLEPASPPVVAAPARLASRARLATVAFDRAIGGFDSWGGAMFRFGEPVNGWRYLFWFVFGLTPLALAITGVSTWLAKCQRCRRADADPASSRARRTVMGGGLGWAIAVYALGVAAGYAATAMRGRGEGR